MNRVKTKQTRKMIIREKLKTKPASGVKRKRKKPRNSHQLVKNLKRPRLMF